MAVSIIVGERCPYCTRYRSPLDFVRQPGEVKICTACEQRHQEALDAFASGEFHGECSECGRAADELKVGNPDGRMAVHFENGRYRVMCLGCDLTYVLKRSELYRGTPFGRALGLN